MCQPKRFRDEYHIHKHHKVVYKCPVYFTLLTLHSTLIRGQSAVIEQPKQVVYKRVPPFTKQYELVPAEGSDALKLGN